MRGIVDNVRLHLVSAAAWLSGLTAFALGGLGVLFLSLFIDAKKFDPFVKAVCRFIVRALFIRVRVEGAKRLQPDRSYLFMANHVNLFDGFVLYGRIPHFVRGVELDEHFSWFFYGWIIRRLGMIPITHRRSRQALESLSAAREALTAGTSILIFPEGHRTPNGRLGPFMRGPFRLAQEAGADIVPVVMVGAYRIQHKGSLMIRPGRMILRFGEPFEHRQYRGTSPDDLAVQVRNRMIELLQDGRPPSAGDGNNHEEAGRP